MTARRCLWDRGYAKSDRSREIGLRCLVIRQVLQLVIGLDNEAAVRVTILHMRFRVMYVELKTGYAHNGPAWITRVRFSKTGRTVYAKGRTLRRIHGGGGQGNHVDIATGEEYWVSGVKKDGTDRHWAGSGPVEVDEDVRDDYERLLRGGAAARS